jgi:glycosidase
MHDRRLRLLTILTILLLFAGPSMARAGTPSPQSWRDITVYQIVTDRFFNGDPSNDNLGGSYDPSDGSRTHGGDFQGLQEKLDYIAGLGVDAVWISPVMINAAGEYHGYAARDLFTISPQMGGLSGLQSFVSAAHARGIYVIIDVVTNHLGDLIGSFDSGYPDYDPAGDYQLSWWNSGNRYDPPFNDLSWFHSNGEIQDYTDPEQIVGELFGLDDLKTELPAVRDVMADAYSQLIQQTDCDGFRIDTVKHVEIGFWQDFAPRIRAAALAEGKDNFLLMGEIYDGDPAKVGYYTGTQAGGAYALNSATWFPMCFAARWVFSGSGFPAVLDWVMADSSAYDPTTRWQLGNFYDNHDMGRMAAQGLAWQDDTLLRQALTWLLTWPGMPILYYGTEQEYDGGGDPWNREDLWDGQWDFGPSQGDGYNMATPLYALTRRLQDLRHQLPAIRRGKLSVLAVDAADPGALVYLRPDPQSPQHDVLVAMNTSWLDTTVTVATRWSTGVIVEDRLGSGRTLTVGGGGHLELHLSSRADFVFTQSSPVTRPRVVCLSPHHDGWFQDQWQKIEIGFDRPMQPASSSYFSIDPPVSFSVYWRNQDTAVLTPTSPWPNGGTWRLRIDATLTAQDSQQLGGTFESIFHSGLGDAGLTLPSGFGVQVMMPFNMHHPLGLEVLPGGPTSTHPQVDAPLVGDVERKRILSLRPNQRVSTYATRPEFLDVVLSIDRDESGAFGGGLLVTTPFHVLQQDTDGIWSQLSTPPTTSEAIVAGEGSLSGYAYLSSPAAGGIYRIAPSGNTTLWATGMSQPRGLEQAPQGHPLAGKLVVCDADLGTGGLGILLAVDSSGAWTSWVSDPLVANGIDIAFAPRGPFGEGTAYVADAINERIVAVSPLGAASVFASGFENLYGSDVLSFGGDGSLYVLDPGGAESITNGGTTALPRVMRISARVATGSPSPRATRVRLDAHPNPFNPRVELSYSLPLPGHVRLDVYDAAGRHLVTLLDEDRPAGAGKATWDGRDGRGHRLSSGVYHARLTTAAQIETVKLTLVR